MFSCAQTRTVFVFRGPRKKNTRKFAFCTFIFFRRFELTQRDVYLVDRSNKNKRKSSFFFNSTLRSNRGKILETKTFFSREKIRKFSHRNNLSFLGDFSASFEKFFRSSTIPFVRRRFDLKSRRKIDFSTKRKVFREPKKIFRDETGIFRVESSSARDVDQKIGEIRRDSFRRADPSNFAAKTEFFAVSIFHLSDFVSERKNEKLIFFVVKMFDQIFEHRN